MCIRDRNHAVHYYSHYYHRNILSIAVYEYIFFRSFPSSCLLSLGVGVHFNPLNRSLISNSGQIDHFRIHMPCYSTKFIYFITCVGFNKFYVGETCTSLRARIRVHKHHIHVPEYQKIKLSEHIDVCGHRQLQVFPFHKLISDNVIERTEKNIFHSTF